MSLKIITIILSDPALQLFADRANYWYHSHTLDRQAQILSQLLQKLAATTPMVPMN